MELNEGAKATATHWSTEIKDGHVEKHRQHFTCQPSPQSCTACHHEGAPQLCPLCRKRTAEDPNQPSWLSGKSFCHSGPSVFAYANLSRESCPESVPLSPPRGANAGSPTTAALAQHMNTHILDG